MRENLVVLRKALGMSVAVELDGVSFAYRRGPPVLEDVNLRSARASSSESPARTVAERRRCFGWRSGWRSPSRATVLLFGEPQAGRRRTLGYLAQRSKVGAGAPVTVRELVSAGRLAARGPFGPLRAPDRIAVRGD